MQKEVQDRHVEDKGSQFCQFSNNSTTLKNKKKHRAFITQLADRRFCRDNVVTSSFRKVTSRKSGEVAKLVEEV